MDDGNIFDRLPNTDEIFERAENYHRSKHPKKDPEQERFENGCFTMFLGFILGGLLGFGSGMAFYGELFRSIGFGILGAIVCAVIAGFLVPKIFPKEPKA